VNLLQEILALVTKGKQIGEMKVIVMSPQIYRSLSEGIGPIYRFYGLEVKLDERPYFPTVKLFNGRNEVIVWKEFKEKQEVI